MSAVVFVKCLFTSHYKLIFWVHIYLSPLEHEWCESQKPKELIKRWHQLAFGEELSPRTRINLNSCNSHQIWPLKSTNTSKQLLTGANVNVFVSQTDLSVTQAILVPRGSFINSITPFEILHCQRKI